MHAEKAARRTKLFGILFGISVGNCLPAAHAGTTTADFLTWEPKAQESFLQISILMIGTIASQLRPDAAQCVNDWYLKSAELQRQRHDEIIELMPEYQDFAPSAVILGVVEAACGRLNSG